MNIDPTRTAPAPEGARPLSPRDLRAATFGRTPLGRRGFDEYEVVRYLDRVAGEIAIRDAAIARLIHDNDKLKHALREWHREMIGYDGVDLVALAQQQVEAQIAQTETYSREREEEAARLYDEIVTEAYEQAERQLRDDRSGDLQARSVRQRTLIVAVLQSLEALATQVDATRQAFGFEMGELEIVEAAPTEDRLATGPPALVEPVEPSDGDAEPVTDSPDR